MIERVANRFRLGRPVREPVRVSGGLSNELWRLDTDRGAFAVKRMVVNADRPSFVGNVEAAFRVERRACAAGVAMPEPVADPATGCALARIDGGLFRVHRWVDGQPGDGSPVEGAGLLATIHAVGRARWAPAPVPVPAWVPDRWGTGLVRFARRVGPGPGRLLVVDSHGDLDRKNTLRGPDRVVMAVDWDAAGPVGAVHEAVAVALDWSDAEPGLFAEALGAYVRLSGVRVPAQPWVFAGWLSGQGGWLDHNATHRGGTPLGAAQVQVTLAHLHRVAANLDELLAAMR